MRMLERNLMAMMDMRLIVHPLLQPLTAESDPVLIPPGKETVRRVPRRTHVEAPVLNLPKRCHLCDRQGYRSVWIRPVEPGSVGAVA